MELPRGFRAKGVEKRAATDSMCPLTRTNGWKKLGSSLCGRGESIEGVLGQPAVEGAFKSKPS